MPIKMIEITEEAGVKHAGTEFEQGERVGLKRLTAEIMEAFVKAGWAKCVDDSVTVGERKPGAVSLNVASVTRKSSS